MHQWYVFHKGNILLQSLSEGRFGVPTGESCPTLTTAHTDILTVTNQQGMEVKTYELEEDVSLPADCSWCALRESFSRLQESDYQTAGKCAELLYWHKNTQYCSICGARMEFSSPISKSCRHCGNEVWPLLATAVIVLITRGDEALLVRAKNFSRPFYGLVAGFVETGESLEEAVEREVKEEVGIGLRNIRYIASQAWPYPCGLMVGFRADYDHGELHIQHSELNTAGWFRRNELPQIPDKASIARRLIDMWREER